MEQNELNDYVQKFLYHFQTQQENPTNALKNIFFQHVKTIFIIWISGFSVVGIPLALFVIGAKGFSYGFTAAFFTMQYGWHGLLFSILSYLPHNLILIPGYLFLTKSSVGLALQFYFMKKRNIRNERDKKQKVLEYALVLLISIGFIMVSSVIEAYFTPRLMRILIPDLIGK